jgi:formylglycine-generating enzyme required for sulfatase activity
MIAVPGGSFQMGSPDGVGLADERPIHRVNLSEFRMSKFEVTQTEYEEIMSTNPSNFGGETDSSERPVEYVTWFDAVEFCNKLSLNDGYQPVYAITGRTPAAGYPIKSATVGVTMTKNGYRLPTEAEWEFAARGGNGSPGGFEYAGSSTIGTVGWYYSNAGLTTHPVGGKASNGFGLCDLTGNVWEWCQDWFGAYGSADQTNPAGPPSGTERTLRGGSYHHDFDVCLNATRSRSSSDVQCEYFGIRVVRRP